MATSRLDDLRMVDPVLSTIAQGYSNTGFVSEALFPIVNVSKLKGKIPVFGKEAFVVRQTNRAVRGGSNRIPPADCSLISFETQERDVEISIDYLEEEESPDFIRYEQRVTKELMDIILLGREKEAADLVQSTSNYASDMYTALTSANCWNNYTLDVDPLKDIRKGMQAIRLKIGKYPNTIVMGETAWQAISGHPKIIEKIKYTEGSNLTLNILSEILGVSNIKIGRSVYSTDGSTLNVAQCFTD